MDVRLKDNSTDRLAHAPVSFEPFPDPDKEVKATDGKYYVKHAE